MKGGTRISELSRVDMGQISGFDSLLIPVSYNGATKIMSLADFAYYNSAAAEGMFDPQFAYQFAYIIQNKDSIAYLTAALQSLIATHNTDIDTMQETQKTTDDEQNAVITTNSTYIANINVVNDTQDEAIAYNKEINDIQATYINDLQQSVSDMQNVEIWGVYGE